MQNKGDTQNVLNAALFTIWCYLGVSRLLAGRAFGTRFFITLRDNKKSSNNASIPLAIKFKMKIVF